MDLAIQQDKTFDYLTEQKWPKSLQNVLVKGSERFPLRYFIIDDSGSMARNDGHRRVGEGAASKLVQCSRWAELVDTVKFHAQLAEWAGLPTEFRMLNGAPPIVLGRKGDDGSAYRALEDILDNSPGGGTPLCRHIEEVTAQLKTMEAQLRANAQKAVIIICTDGEASDGNISLALQPLHDMPVWVVIRLCTDESGVSEYWNRIDNELELEMDVLDDLYGEAKEIEKINPWMTYGEPLHRLREWGVQLKELDLIDEAALSTEQMRAVCALLYTDGKQNALPHPDLSWPDFLHAINECNAKEADVWDCMGKRGKHYPWVRVNKLNAFYQKKGCSIM